jgi:hypothetical protein
MQQGNKKMYNFEQQVKAVLAQNNREIPIPVIIDTWFRSCGAHLEPCDKVSLAKITEKGFEAVKRFMVGDYFWHPDCTKCPRCLNHRPEVNKGNKLCNRCNDIIKTGG